MDIKNIYCPKCKKTVLTIYGKNSFISRGHCRKCRIGIVYNPSNNKIQKTKYPERESSSSLNWN